LILSSERKRDEVAGMTDEGVCWLSIDELARRYRAGDLSPVDVTRSLLDRIGKLDGALQSFLLVLEGEALRAAEESERRHRAA
jgi:Asp-tRNA(Asn)/Glu-tRNA(Gln) amidotransferase A subunit family amidase